MGLYKILVQDHIRNMAASPVKYKREDIKKKKKKVGMILIFSSDHDQQKWSSLYTSEYWYEHVKCCGQKITTLPPGCAWYFDSPSVAWSGPLKKKSSCLAKAKLGHFIVKNEKVYIGGQFAYK